MTRQMQTEIPCDAGDGDSDFAEPAAVAVNTDRQPDGYIETAHPETGEPDMMAFWLPDGVTVDDLRLARAI